VAIYRQLALCERIRYLRVREKYTQAHVAKKLLVSQAAYCRLERGEIEFTINKLFELADMYGVTASELLANL